VLIQFTLRHKIYIFGSENGRCTGELDGLVPDPVLNASLVRNREVREFLIIVGSTEFKFIQSY
jgi:hypothetical protein